MVFNRNVCSAMAPAVLTATLWVTSAVASAQTAAAVSTPPDDSASSLGPYLFTFILAGGGIIAAIAVKLCDKLVKSDEVQWKADGSRRVMGITTIR